LGVGLSGGIQDDGRSTSPRAPVEELEIPSINTGTNRFTSLRERSAPRLAGEVVGSIPTRSTKSH